jgi:hypothetical protein
MTLPLLYKFTLAALLLIWPAAVVSPHYPSPKVDAPWVPMTPETLDVDVLAYCFGGASGIATERRVCRIAREVAAVVDEHAAQDRIPFTGPAAQQATVLALLEIAHHESGFRSKVEDCRITGDLPAHWSKITEGRAVSLFQLQANNHEDLFVTEGVRAGTSIPRPKKYSRAAICKSNELAVTLALYTLMRKAWTVDKTPRPKSVASMFYLYSSGKGTPSKAGREHVKAFEAMMRQHKIAMVPKNGPMWAEVRP